MSEKAEIKVEDVILGPGAVTFVREAGHIPGLDGAPEQALNPDHYKVVFDIRTAVSYGDCISADRFALTVITQPKSARHDYREMEAEAARYLAPMLRSVADKLQAQIEGSEAERAASPQKPE